MKAIWAVAVGAIVAVPILGLPAEEPVRVAQQSVTAPADRQLGAGISLVVDQGNGSKGTLHIGL